MRNNSEVTVGNDNLKPWQPGQSGNPAGRPKGSRNLKTVIQDMLTDPNVCKELSEWNDLNAETPLEAIIYALFSKAVDGDLKAADILFKYGYGTASFEEEYTHPPVALVRFMETETP